MPRKITHSHLVSLQVKAETWELDNLTWHVAYISNWEPLNHSVFMQKVYEECMKIIEQYSKDPEKTLIIRGPEHNNIIRFYFIDEQDYINYFIGF